MAKTSRGPRKDDRPQKDKNPRRPPAEGERRPGDGARQRKDEEEETRRPEGDGPDEWS